MMEKTKSELACKKLPKLCLNSIPCEALQKQREKGERTMVPLTAQMKVIPTIHGTANVLKKFGMGNMTREILIHDID